MEPVQNPQIPAPKPEDPTRKKLRIILFIGTALAAISMSAALILVLTSSSDSGRTEASARKAAEKQLELTEEGDWCGAWDMWTEEGQQAISCEDWGRFLEACDPSIGMPLEVASVRVDDDVATVIIERDDVRGSYKMYWEDDEWRWQPSERALSDWETDVDELIERC